MTTKTITVEHPESHRASQDQYDEALIAAEVPDGYTVAHIVNESGVATRYTLKWGDEADPEKQQEPPEGDPTAEPTPKSRRR